MNNQAPSLERRIEEVQHYYGDTLTDKQDLATRSVISALRLHLGSA